MDKLHIKSRSYNTVNFPISTIHQTKLTPCCFVYVRSNRGRVCRYRSLGGDWPRSTHWSHAVSTHCSAVWHRSTHCSPVWHHGRLDAGDWHDWPCLDCVNSPGREGSVYRIEHNTLRLSTFRSRHGVMGSSPLHDC